MRTTAGRTLSLQLLHCLTGDAHSDAELLRRYADGGDEDAFAELVRRNGPLVLRTCRHVLGETTAAEDAFQATFLMLVRKTGQLPRTGSLAGWLHAVALRTARDARRANRRRRCRERTRYAPPSPPTPADDLTWREVRERLDTELAALPEKYRVPLALCYLQELSYEDAARQAGCSVGALRGRLERGKGLLRKRLARFGLPMAAPFLVFGRPPGVHAALAAATLATVRAGMTGGRIAPAVAGLVESTFRLKATLMALAGLLVVAVGVTLVASGGPAAVPPTDSKPPTQPNAAASDPRDKPHLDALGDPLPPGAVTRLGTRRFQVPTFPFGPISLPGGKTYLVYEQADRTNRGAAFHWMDAASGQITDTWPIANGLDLVGVSPDGRWALLTAVKFEHTDFRVAPPKPDRSLVLYLYDLTTRKEVNRFDGEFEESEGDSPSVHAARFSADSKWFTTVNAVFRTQGRVRLWSAESGKQVWASEWGKDGGPSFEPLGFSANNAELVLRRTEDNRVCVVDVARGKMVRDFGTMERDKTYECYLSPDGSTVLIGAYAADVRMWDVKTGKELPSLTGHKQWARVITFGPDGKTLITGGNDGYVLVRDWPSGKVRKQIDLGRGSVEEMAVTADGRTLTVLFWWETALHRYDLETGRRLPFPADSHLAEVYGVEALADGSILSLGKDTVLRTWKPATGRQTGKRRLDTTTAWAPFSLSPDAKVIAVANYDRTALLLLERDSGQMLRNIATPGGEIDRGVLSPDGRWIAGTGERAKAIRVWDAATGEKVLETPAKAGGWWATPACAFSPDGRILVTTEEGRVLIWDVGTWRAAGELAVHAGGLAFSPDGRSLACVDLNDVMIWEMTTRTLRFKHRLANQCATLPRFSPDGRFLAWLNSTQTIEVWDLLRDQQVDTFQGHDHAITALTFTADSRLLVSGSDDCTLLVWDLAGAATKLKNVAVPTDRELRTAWDDLASPDGEKAFAAIRTMIASSDASVDLIRERLRPVLAPAATKVQQLLANLDNDHFEVREQASRDLKALGDGVEAHLRKFLAGKPSPEARRRIEDLLGAILDGRLQSQRAVEVLERIGTTTGHDVLRQLAKGDPEAALTRDVKSVLRRIERGK
jgi:RNA polymerase sigma factor (sigma-70 family)